VLAFGDYRKLSPGSNHRKRVNYFGEEKVAILRAHFVEGLLQEHVQLKKANWGLLSRCWGPHDTRDQIVDCSPGAVYQVLRQADVLRPRGRESRKGKGFVQPLTTHEHCHIDVADINIAGTFIFMAKPGEHELTADGRKNLQRIEKPRDDRLTLKYPPARDGETM
jgi:hypothetical protein